MLKNYYWLEVLLVDPRFYEDPTDNMDDKVANEIIDFITAKEHQWTIIVSSKNQYWKEQV
jgi:hypothetical protein